jgi:hypothetical protein
MSFDSRFLRCLSPDLADYVGILCGLSVVYEDAAHYLLYPHLLYAISYSDYIITLHIVKIFILILILLPFEKRHIEGRRQNIHLFLYFLVFWEYPTPSAGAEASARTGGWLSRWQGAG